MRRLFAAVSLVPLAASLAAAQESGWPETYVCGAAVQTYFFLDAAPKIVGDAEGFTRFRSASGNVYQCRITEQGRVFLRWINKDRLVMTSQKVEVSLHADLLTVKTDMSTKTFRKSDSGWSTVD